MHQIKYFINLVSNINAMMLKFAAKLGLTLRKTNVGAQKIDDLSLKINSIVSARFLLQDRLRKVWFFEKTFLLADTRIKFVLEMLFQSLSNTNFQFCARKLT